jgi:hypothetical protein
MPIVAALVLLWTIAQPPAAAAKPADVAGKWNITLDMAMGTASPWMMVTQDGEKLSGTYTSGRYGDFSLEGTIKDHAIDIRVTIEAEGQTVPMRFMGTVSADAAAMKGHATLGELGDGTWSAARAPLSK